jgi:Na+-translocating ferredoxin:NAD+ oxidoreductase subunit G
MKDALKLAILCAAAVVLLSLLFMLLGPIIENNCQGKICADLEEIAGLLRIGERRTFTGDPVITGYYPLYDKTGICTAYVVEMYGEGYSGPIHILAGIYKDGAIFSVHILDHSETPGIGDLAENPGYMKKFMETGGSSIIPQSKDDLSSENAMAVSGATVTFLGIGEVLLKGSVAVLNLKETQ